jgi:hypothetical protein
MTASPSLGNPRPSPGIREKLPERVWAQKSHFTSAREHHLLGGRWPWETRNNFTTKCHIVLQIGSNYSEKPTLQMHVA